MWVIFVPWGLALLMFLTLLQLLLSLFRQQLTVAETRRFSETDSMGNKCSAGPSRCDPKLGQREGAHALLAPSAGAISTV